MVLWLKTEQGCLRLVDPYWASFYLSGRETALKQCASYLSRQRLSVTTEQTERREVISKQLEANLVKLYDILKEKRQGLGVVGAKDETCQGCFVNIPPQMFIEVQKNNALIRCPNCNRILYWEGNGKKK